VLSLARAADNDTQYAMRGSADLNGDGKAEPIAITWKQGQQTFILQVGAQTLTERLENAEWSVEGFRVVDLNTQTREKELEILLSPDGVYAAYRYYAFDGTTLSRLGELTGSDTYVEIVGAGGFLYFRSSESFWQLTQKFTLNPKTRRLEEVPQPFYYVGTPGTVKQSQPIYATREKKTVVANLQVNSDIEVLLKLGDWYLMKSTTGLVGWIHEKDLTNQRFFELPYAD